MIWMIRFALTVILAAGLSAQRPEWTRPFPGHKIAGNLYYVGTEDLACFLITTLEGNILINTGLADSVPLMRASAQKLGLKLEDTRILLTMQAHFDHVAAMREVQKLSGARVMATEGDAPVLEDGGKSDPFLTGERVRFAPVKVDRRLKDGETIRLGGTELVVHLTPGHTRGSVSYSMNVTQGGRKYNVLIANMGSVVMPLVGNAKYPEIVTDLAASFRKQKAMKPDIWAAAHASHYGMQAKLKAGSFVDPKGYQKAIDHYEKLYLERLAKERQ
jgi:metallo-beta-lactamase class B